MLIIVAQRHNETNNIFSTHRSQKRAVKERKYFYSQTPIYRTPTCRTPIYNIVKGAIASARTTRLPEKVKLYSKSLQLFNKTQVFEEFSKPRLKTVITLGLALRLMRARSLSSF